MATVAAFFTAVGQGVRLAVAVFGARNSPALQANKKAETFQKIKDSVEKHIADGDDAAIERDISG